jgi:hypothetical protein
MDPDSLVPGCPRASQIVDQVATVVDRREQRLGHQGDDGLRVTRPVMSRGGEVAGQIGEQPG